MKQFFPYPIELSALAVIAGVVGLLAWRQNKWVRRTKDDHESLDELRADLLALNDELLILRAELDMRREQMRRQGMGDDWGSLN